MRISDWSSDVCSSDLSGDPSFVIFAKLSVSGIFERRHITEVRDSVIGRVYIDVIDLSVGPFDVMDRQRDSMGEQGDALYMAEQMTCALRRNKGRFSCVLIVIVFALSFWVSGRYVRRSWRKHRGN